MCERIFANILKGVTDAKNANAKIEKEGNSVRQHSCRTERAMRTALQTRHRGTRSTSSTTRSRPRGIIEEEWSTRKSMRVIIVHAEEWGMRITIVHRSIKKISS